MHCVKDGRLGPSWCMSDDDPSVSQIYSSCRYIKGSQKLLLISLERQDLIGFLYYIH